MCAQVNAKQHAEIHAGGVEVLVGHSEVVMCDFAACLLAELERWMLNASPAMIDLNSFADTSDYFTAPTSALEEVSKRLYTDEVGWSSSLCTPIYIHTVESCADIELATMWVTLVSAWALLVC